MSRNQVSCPPTSSACGSGVGFYAPPGIWREIELAANQTLAELGTSIPPAFRFDDDHLWSFFLSGKPWIGPASTPACPTHPSAGPSATPTASWLATHRPGRSSSSAVRLRRRVAFRGQARPDRRRRARRPLPPRGGQPGPAPPQYPDLDDEDDPDEAPYFELAPPCQAAGPGPRPQGAAPAGEAAPAPVGRPLGAGQPPPSCLCWTGRCRSAT